MPNEPHQAQLEDVEKLGVTLRSEMRPQAASPEHAQRQIESQALDDAQVSIWSAVLEGNPEAIKLFLQIHDRRVKLLGLVNDQADQHWTIQIKRDGDGVEDG